MQKNNILLWQYMKTGLSHSLRIFLPSFTPARPFNEVNVECVFSLNHLVYILFDLRRCFKRKRNSTIIDLLDHKHIFVFDHWCCLIEYDIGSIYHGREQILSLSCLIIGVISIDK